jgi:aspartyl-tRNA(Asn)/glutamyl-tRNA(Gln) amidotransferase subunit A
MHTLAEVSELIRQRRLSPVELVSTCLERVEQMQPALNAFITIAAVSARQAAQVAEQEMQAGNYRGPLHGIPVGIKDFYDTAGITTTAAFEHFTSRVPATDAVAVEKLKNAGAIIIGKTNMHTLGMGTTGLVSYFGAVKNPVNADYIPGGSSSGSAAAIATGLCFATVDTDAIGSCRLPAACCGVVGFKGSYGSIDMTGILAGEQPPDDMIRWLSCAGITTRSSRDTALVLSVLGAAPVPAGDRALRIGVADNIKADDDVTKAFANAVEKIRTLGHAMTKAKAPFVDFKKGLANIEADRQAIGAQAFADIDVLILPTTNTTTPLVKDAAKDPQFLSPALTMFANYYGLPAISLPCGGDRHGLPLGFQIVAKAGDDAAVLQLARQYEAPTAVGA